MDDQMPIDSVEHIKALIDPENDQDLFSRAHNDMQNFSLFPNSGTINPTQQQHQSGHQSPFQINPPVSTNDVPSTEASNSMPFSISHGMSFSDIAATGTPLDQYGPPNNAPHLSSGSVFDPDTTAQTLAATWHSSRVWSLDDLHQQPHTESERLPQQSQLLSHQQPNQAPIHDQNHMDMEQQQPQQPQPQQQQQTVSQQKQFQRPTTSQEKQLEFGATTPDKPAQPSGRIPKVAPTSTSSSTAFADTLDSFTMIELQKKHKEYDACQNEALKKMHALERDMNDLTRSAKGKNVELDPSFRQKKDDIKRIEITYTNYKEKMRTIADKLSSKFNVKMSSGMSAPSKPLSKRAKMSTTPRNKTHDQLLSNNRIRNYELELLDSGAWCNICDEHFSDLPEFCSHLHSKGHQRAKPPVSPWRKNRKEKIDVKKTYNLLKSIAAKISNEHGTDFTLTHLHRALEPGTDGDKEAYLKERNLTRERNEFDPLHDPVLQVKGYNYLIPTTGYYCSLCEARMCDIEEVTEHLRGYNHATLFCQAVALNPKHETSLRTVESKSRELIKRTRDSRLGISTTSASSSTTTTTTTKSATKDASYGRVSGTTNPATVATTSYKKATSRIVDDHESIRDKFQPPRRPLSRTSTSSRPGPRRILSDEDDLEENDSPGNSHDETTNITARKRTESSARSSASAKNIRASGSPTTASAGRRKRAAPPEIVPIGGPLKQAPSLKQLKSTSGQAVAKNEKVERAFLSVHMESESEQEREPGTESDDSDDEPVIVKTLNYDDPDSPFPLLELSVTGNTHINALKDKRLALPCRVVMNRLDMSTYEGTLLDPSTLFSRVVQLVTKREAAKASIVESEMKSGVKSSAAASFDAIFGQSACDTGDEGPKACYFDAAGEDIPVDLDDRSN